MSYTTRLVCVALAGIVTSGVTASAYADPWFGNAKKAQPQASAQTAAQKTDTDLKQAAVTYINGLCKLPKEQRDALMRELNEALLPNHATISCGPGAGT